MADLSFLARLVLTVLLSALSLFVYKWLQTPSPPAPQSSTKRVKKRSKKKSAKKSASSESPSPPQQSPQKLQRSAAPAKAPAAAALIASEDDVSDSDSDDGLSAAQVLATRKFKPKNLGGTRLARKIKASLPPANAPRYAVDQEVLARFGGGNEWFPATILEQRKGNEYHLKYDDGEVEYRVPAEFIKIRPAKSDESNDDSEAARIAEAKKAPESAAVQEELSDSSSSESDEDGWQVVGASSAAKRQARRTQAAASAEPLVDDLTKRQRENRRKKERQREKKELLRQHAQKDDLDARARWRYVPS
ncbi:hypothetical protein F441_03376 [Phytophthora nicotianae CJ01A1]|uniref:Agenet domain-containing protein n=5 Tax=Phytophthora nicotianae TaxID=4792 RepID=W2QMJ4_PHYN3|nr:hypothetical protein PPTG_07950 [Phytophthora nicotianae INRA-310]ETI53713.1 hypothetical protein F443_03387 [Phytophthora nicotianae P1569]ETK93595.1 hypothetical protein L915_03259 [Phytophthora nicotianae]ETO82401.1 hypothetical protein F444_03457 [Phytophthora nicotianae P1976]ETP23520.1 hypothetical protein F441_03376 [Phytophthora nicotianae CJ01A1]ETM00091.1 hypothetical protein L917_03157 [Phytophthora nicotianae]